MFERERERERDRERKRERERENSSSALGSEYNLSVGISASLVGNEEKEKNSSDFLNPPLQTKRS